MQISPVTDFIFPRDFFLPFFTLLRDPRGNNVTTSVRRAATRFISISVAATKLRKITVTQFRTGRRFIRIICILRARYLARRRWFSTTWLQLSERLSTTRREKWPMSAEMTKTGPADDGISRAREIQTRSNGIPGQIEISPQARFDELGLSNRNY